MAKCLSGKKKFAYMVAKLPNCDWGCSRKKINAQTNTTKDPKTSLSESKTERIAVGCIM